MWFRTATLCIFCLTSDLRRLYLQVKPNGVKAWRYRFKLGGKGSWFALGDYPAISLAQARDKSEEARKLVKQGINPAQHRQLERIKRAQENATTFEAVAKEWLALRDWEEITKKRGLDMLTRVVFPTIGQMPVKQITPPVILGILKKAAEKNGVSVMNEAKRTLFGIFEMAAETFRVDSNPVHQWREALPKNKTQHKRPLEIAEIGKLLRDFDGHGGRHETITAFRLMWLTLTRPREAVEARWDEFDLDAAIWRIPAQRMKKRKEHVVPLPTQAVDMLRTLHALTGRHAHLFTHRDDKTKPMATASFRQALKALGWAGKYSPHATRTTGSTRLNELSYAIDWIERQLSHTEPNAVRRTYNHAEHLADRARMMQQWADMLDTWKKGDSNVTPIRQAA